MKIRVIQSLYSNNINDADYLFDLKIKEINKCTKSDDILVLPEYSDVPVTTSNEEDTLLLHNKYIDTLHETCVKIAKKCNMLVFYNALELVNGKYRNTTFGVDKNGQIVAKYYKRHIPIGEKSPNFDHEYTSKRDEIYTVTIDNIKYAFLTCYDLYFYEYFPRIAEIKPDIIIVCSLQRSDMFEATKIMCQFLAYNTNAYVVRSSVTYENGTNICGASMVVSPTGEVLLNMLGKSGSKSIDINPKEKYFKPGGFGQPNKSHFDYMKEGRIPSQYGLDDDKK